MPTGDSRELEVVGLVGQWIGAVLETAGLYALSDILTTFAAYFFAMPSSPMWYPYLPVFSLVLFMVSFQMLSIS